MTINLFRFMVSQTFGLRDIARTLHREFEAEGIPQEALTQLQEIIVETDKLFDYIRYKAEFEYEVVDHLNDYPRCTAEWLRLMNQLYENASKLIREFSITGNGYMERGMSLLEDYQKGCFAAKEFSKDIYINLVIDSIQRSQARSSEISGNLVNKRFSGLMRYIIHLQETSQEQEANELLERLMDLDLNYAPLSLAYIQILIRRQEHSAAKEIIEQILEEDPENKTAIALRSKLSEM